MKDGAFEVNEGEWQAGANGQLIKATFNSRGAAEAGIEVEKRRQLKRDALSLMDVTRDDCERFGIDFKQHECGCEVCARSTKLCPATQSSIIEAIRVKYAT